MLVMMGNDKMASDLGFLSWPNHVANVTSMSKWIGSVLKIVMDVEEIGPPVVGHSQEGFLSAQATCSSSTRYAHIVTRRPIVGLIFYPDPGFCSRCIRRDWPPSQGSSSVLPLSSLPSPVVCYNTPSSRCKLGDKATVLPLVMKHGGWS